MTDCIGIPGVMKNERFRSKATFILVPSNLCQQWKKEIEKCVPTSVLQIHILKGKASEITFEQVFMANILVMSYQHLDKSHGRRKGVPLKPLLFDEDESFIKFLFNEFIRLKRGENGLLVHINALSASYIWCLTGTPKFGSAEDVKTYARLITMYKTPKRKKNGQKYKSSVEMDLGQSWGKFSSLEAFRFIQNRVRRNEHVVKYPKPMQEIIWVKLIPGERNLYQSYEAGRVSDKMKLRICAHYQFKIKDGKYPECIKTVTSKLQQDHKKQLDKLKKEISVLQESSQKMSVGVLARHCRSDFKHCRSNFKIRNR
ncbi:hypothetical protein HK096_005334 [Nowakowskiella sp. JEL0078]|nr:hypothetical protein HK096_005334 [Nowakowskiella sp. JEL0078]